MAADVPGQDPKSLWMDQEQETDPMTLAQIHALVRHYDNKDRRRIVLLAFVAFAVGAVGVLSWTRMHDPVMSVLFIVGELATLYLAYHRMFPARDPAEPAGEYLRRRLTLRLQYLRGRWILGAAPLLPCILWIGYVMYQRSQLPLGRRLAPFIIVAGAIVWMVIRIRPRARKARADLTELDGLLGR